jgi:PhnB protein
MGVHNGQCFLPVIILQRLYKREPGRRVFHKVCSVKSARLPAFPLSRLPSFKETHVEVAAYLSFNGDCEAAFKYYMEVVGAKPGFLFSYGSSSMADVLPEGWENKIMHGSVTIGGTLLEGADAPPERYQKPQGFSLSLNVPSADEAERLFEKLGNGGRVVYPIAKTFWSERFGMVVDRFGIPWMINCETPRG